VDNKEMLRQFYMVSRSVYPVLDRFPRSCWVAIKRLACTHCARLTHHDVHVPAGP
jgi:acetone carboxylase gamma subunit